MVAAAILASTPTLAQKVDTTLWVTNGSVNAVVRDGNTIYIGGDFTLVGPATGGGVPLSMASGGPVGPLPKVHESVSAAVPDGSGGWYIGGTFAAVGGLPRSNLAHILADGTVAAWDPSPNNLVDALAVSGGTVYAGGTFTSIGGQARNRIAALNATSGAATAWDPDASWPVYALIVSGSTVYAGGSFSSIGGQARKCIAALDATTGEPTAWDPHANGYVHALAVSGATVYAGGEFSAMGDQPQSGIASMGDNTTGTLLVRFDAEVGDDGVLLRWQFGTPVRSVCVERAGSESGPWTPLSLERRDEGEVAEALDRSADPGHTYWYRLGVILGDGAAAIFGPVRAELPGRIAASGLTLIAPNPSSGQTRIDFVVAQREQVRLSVVDVAGRELEVIAEGVRAPGRYSALWDGRQGAASLPPGVYFLRWESPGRLLQKRVVLFR